MIAVTFALPTESSDFIRGLESPVREVCGRTHIIRGRIDGRDVSVLHSGVGERAARDCMRRFFLHEPHPRLLISAGFAGALQDGLQIGELFVGENFSDANLLTKAKPALSGFPFQSGRLASARAVTDNAAERRELAEASGALAVDMETEAIAEACAAVGVPVFSLRMITDTPSQPLPAPPEILFNVERQKTEVGKLAAYLITNPRAISGLLMFARRVAAARATLAAALACVLRELPR